MMKSHAVAEAMLCSKSLARRRLRLSHARVCSTTQRRGRTTKPLAGVVKANWLAGRRLIFWGVDLLCKPVPLFQLVARGVPPPSPSTSL